MVDAWLDTKHTQGLDQFAGFLKGAVAKVDAINQGVLQVGAASIGSHDESLPRKAGLERDRPDVLFAPAACKVHLVRAQRVLQFSNVQCPGHNPMPGR